jgi:hypothetical protein
MTIARDQFELYESVILTEQVTPAAIRELLRDNPDFAVWYCARRTARAAAPKPPKSDEPAPWRIDGDEVIAADDTVVMTIDGADPDHLAFWQRVVTAINARTATIEAIAAVKRAFGAPGDYGYGTAKGDALFALYRAATGDGASR